MPPGVAMAMVRLGALKTGTSWKEEAVFRPLSFLSMRRARWSWSGVGRKWNVSGKRCGGFLGGGWGVF